MPLVHIGVSLAVEVSHLERGAVPEDPCPLAHVVLRAERRIDPASLVLNFIEFGISFAEEDSARVLCVEISVRDPVTQQRESLPSSTGAAEENVFDGASDQRALRSRLGFIDYSLLDCCCCHSSCVCFAGSLTMVAVKSPSIVICSLGLP